MYANWFEAPPYFTVGRLAELQAEFSESLHLSRQALSFAAVGDVTGSSMILARSSK